MTANRPHGGGVRVLVLSADVGESHAEMARILRRELERRGDVEPVKVLNDFSVLGSLLDCLLFKGFDFHLGKVQWSYDPDRFRFGDTGRRAEGKEPQSRRS